MSMSAAPRSRSADTVMAAFRVMLGVLFLSVWASNVDKGLYGAGEYAALIDGYAEDGDAPAFWKELMRSVADNAGAFSKLQLVAELAFGVLLALGLLTRLVALAAGLFLTAVWVSEIGVPNEWIWSLVFPAMAAFAVAWLPAARAYSLDERLRGRLPRWATG
jgi:uncharacterized membrane protein YphA (DoxX/SURF4 family)